MNLSVCRHEVDSVAVVSCRGELDGESAERLSAELELALDARPPAMVVDLGGLTFIDSTGVHVVVRKRAASVAVETTVLVVAVAERIRDVFRLTGLAEGVDLHRSIPDALTSLLPDPRVAVAAHPIHASGR
ncbi:STAS domain-containing protein [Georgenia thermotolerans]|nr:STAS domain-containing protein [Georgenia thermotolerans]